MSSYRDDSSELGPHAVPPEQLRALVRTRDPAIDRQAVLSALRRRPDVGVAEKIADLAGVLRDGAEEPSLRFAAATELGRLATRETRAALTDALEMAVARGEPDLVVRGAAGALLASDLAEPAVIAELLADRPEALHALRFPLTLYAFRHDLDPEELNAPALDLAAVRAARVRKDHAQPMVVQPASPEVVRRTAEGAGSVLGGAELDGRAATCLQCGVQSLVVAPVAGLLSAHGLARLQRRRALVGVVSVHYHLESDSWEPKYVIATRPGAKARTLELILLDTGGGPAFVGDVTVSDADARFALRAVRKPGAIPARLKGRVRAGRLEFDEAVSELHKVDRRRPRPLAAPRRR